MTRSLYAGLHGRLYITRVRRKSVQFAGISQICTESPAQLTDLLGEDQPVAYINIITQLYCLNKNLERFLETISYPPEATIIQQEVMLEEVFQ